MPWRPGQRHAARALEDPFDDVPLHLGQPLFDWMQGAFVSTYEVKHERFRQVAMRLRTTFPGSDSVDKLDYIRDRCNADNGFLLDIVEALLELYGWDNRRAFLLEELLGEANSAYTVREDWHGLEERVAPGVKQSVSAVVASASGSAGDHLVDAWNEAYGRQQDPVKSYSESIKAVEAALARRVSPQNGKQTLGTMIRDVSAKPSKWQFAIVDGSVGGVETVLYMMRKLWDGQTSRHGGPGPTRSETVAEAQAAVHLAATLVQFGVSGAVSLK